MTQLKGKCEDKAKFICWGLGVGLSWGIVVFKTDQVVISNLVEVGGEFIDSRYVV